MLVQVTLSLLGPHLALESSRSVYIRLDGLLTGVEESGSGACQCTASYFIPKVRYISSMTAPRRVLQVASCYKTVENLDRFHQIVGPDTTDDVPLDYDELEGIQYVKLCLLTAIHLYI